MVVFDYNAAKGKLSARWENTMEIELMFVGGCVPTRQIVMLVRSHHQLNDPLIDLPSQHCAALSDFAVSRRRIALAIILQGPCAGCGAVQSLTNSIRPGLAHLKLIKAPQLEESSMSLLVDSLPLLQSITVQDCFLDGAALLKLGTGWPRLHTINLSNNQLDADAIAGLTQATGSKLRRLHLHSDILDVACIQQLTSCSWPSLQILALEHADIDVPAVNCLAQGSWPALQCLNLTGNKIGATGISHLVQGNWPRLGRLILSDQGLDEEACLLLGIAEVVRSRSTSDGGFEYKSDLPQFSDLIVRICTN